MDYFKDSLLAAVFVTLFSVGTAASADPIDDGLNHSVDKPSKHFIIGGQPDQNNTYPFTVALTYNIQAPLVQRQFCGGSVIADTWVLTAAHCLFDRRGDLLQLSDFKVAIDARDLNSNSATELVVTNAIVHPEYQHDARNPHSDMALLELAGSTGIEPIKLSTKAMDSLVGLQATVAGWGAVENDNPSNPQYPVLLHSVDVPLVSLDVCNDPVSYDNSLFNNQICAGYAVGGKDSCVGDSGGPLFVTYEGELQQVGIVSFGFGCALPNYYGIYTNVPFFIGWINQYVYVGEPEFTPELVVPRNSQTSAVANSGNSDSGATSLFALLILCTGILLRRRNS